MLTCEPEAPTLSSTTSRDKPTTALGHGRDLRFVDLDGGGSVGTEGLRGLGLARRSLGQRQGDWYAEDS